CLQYDSDPLTF
nr:immunoglobulin light chain junction region [Macaca mulatta]MOV37621.1 immunoglobulin light chain junction region [Macaca mulatta]MOV37633.1 immunoglobulin light chain junction region [Macaca mulatta]MOV37673.1 immunoglobulin light chain junction region [Macaca mulatta]MOV37711.1 immunoglobulin light chain junction region [Macaca mulatta]